MDKKRIICKVGSSTNFSYIIEKLNLPYFYENGEKKYFYYDENIKAFWQKKDNKIIYETHFDLFFDKDSFFGFHRDLIPKEIKFYEDFCPPSYYFYDEEEQENFINTLDENAINELKETRYYDDKKIIRFFGPKKNGKSTLVYYYFGMRRFIPIKEMNKIEDIITFNKTDKDINSNNIINLDENDNNIEKIDEDDIFNNNDYFKSQNYNKDLINKKMNADDDIPYLDENIQKLKVVFIKKKDSNIEKINKINKNNIFSSEFSYTENDTLGFFRSCYLNNDFLKNKKYPEDFILKTLYFEFEGLFKSYRVYKLFISQFIESFSFPNNIIEIGQFILEFMRKYNQYRRRYFIIFDSISYDLIDKLKKFEKEARKDPNCYIIELFKNYNITNFFCENIIHENIETDILVLYSQNFSILDLVQDLDLREKNFLNDNFRESLYYYQKYKKWKNNNNNNNNYNDFLLKERKEVENDLLKENIGNNEAKAAFKFIYLSIIYKKDIDEKLIKNLNLDYFFVEKKDQIFKVKTLPFIIDIIKDLSKNSIKSLLDTEYFINSDDYIKSSIIEDIAKEEIKNIFKMNAKNPNDYQEVDIHRLLDNEIYTFYTEDIIKLILNKKKKYQEIKKRYLRKNLKFKNKITIFNLYQNTKHYDLGILFYDKLFLIQSTINKTNKLIDEIIEFNSIDLNYIIYKIMDMTGENYIIKEIYCFLLIAKMESIFENNDNPYIQNLILKNKKNNKKLTKSIINSKFNIIYLGKEGKIYDQNNNLISKVIIPNKEYQLFNCHFGKKIYLNKTKLELKKTKLENKLKKSKVLPIRIDKNSIKFYSLYYPKIEIPNNLISYYEYPNEDIYFFKINDRFYDDNLNECKDMNDFIDKHQFDIHGILLFKYEKQ